MGSRPSRPQCALSLAIGSALLIPLGAPLARAADDSSAHTSTSIEHLIVVVGENHTFDNLYGAFKPREGQSIKNLRPPDLPWN